MKRQKKRSTVDKSLKKLSRIELLELLVGLSEEYEKLRAENIQLRKTLSDQRLPRSTKVGSIAEAALGANGYFEAAQRSADEYLREIKRLRDELALHAEEEGQSVDEPSAIDARVKRQAQSILRDARSRADRIVQQANSQAESILADARARSEESIANANRQSHAILSRAGKQAHGAASPSSTLPSIAVPPIHEGAPSVANTAENAQQAQRVRPVIGRRSL